MRKNLLEFLFGPAAVDDSSRALGEDVVKLFEDAANTETEQMVANKKPLVSALKDIGIDAAVHEAPQWCGINCENEDQYREHLKLLRDPDAMHKLAEKGWVMAQCGDQAMSNEPPSFKIGFIELDMLGMPDNKQDSESLETVIKNAQKFATTPLDRDDDELNPVETDRKPGKSPRKRKETRESHSPAALAHQLLESCDLSEMTTCSAIPAVETPIGTVKPIGTPKRNRLATLRKRHAKDEQNQPDR